MLKPWSFILFAFMILSGHMAHAQTANAKADLFEIYPNYVLGSHVSNILLQMKNDGFTYHKGFVYPSRTDDLLDSNLTSVIYVHLPGYDTVYSTGPYLNLVFHKNRLVCISYCETLTSKKDAFKMFEPPKQQLGICSDSSDQFKTHDGIYDYIHISSYDKTFRWQGIDNDVVCIYADWSDNQQIIEITKINRKNFKLYRKDMDEMNKGWDKAEIKDKKVLNNVYWENEIIGTMIHIVANRNKISKLEKLFPSYLRDGLKFFSPIKDQNGTYWGLEDTKKPSYYYYGYHFLEKAKDGSSRYSAIAELIAYMSMKNEVFRITLDFSIYGSPSLSQLELMILAEEFMPEQSNAPLTKCYRDLLGHTEVTLVLHDNNSVDHMTISVRDIKDYMN